MGAAALLARHHRGPPSVGGARPNPILWRLVARCMPAAEAFICFRSSFVHSVTWGRSWTTCEAMRCPQGGHGDPEGGLDADLVAAAAGGGRGAARIKELLGAEQGAWPLPRWGPHALSALAALASRPAVQRVCSAS